ncbi:MAG: hypothetical protein ACRC42_03960 [Mycoplasma sp.]
MSISAIEADKFYTSPEAANAFVKLIKKHVNLDSFDNIIEPSAGNGALLKVLPARTIGVDLYPEAEGIIEHDFLTWQPPAGKSCLISNPPFGSHSELAIKFFVRASEYCDTIAMIIPNTWETFKIQKQLPSGWGLVANERLPKNSFLLEGKKHNVNCSLQIWKKQEDAGLRMLEEPPKEHEDFIFVGPNSEFDVSVIKTTSDATTKFVPASTPIKTNPTNRLYMKCRDSMVVQDLLGLSIERVGIKPFVTRALIVKAYEEKQQELNHIDIYTRPWGNVGRVRDIFDASIWGDEEEFKMVAWQGNRGLYNGPHTNKGKENEI